MRDFCCGLDFGGGLDPEGEGSWGGPMCLSPKWQWFRNLITLYAKLGVDLQNQVAKVNVAKFSNAFLIFLYVHFSMKYSGIPTKWQRLKRF